MQANFVVTTGFDALLLVWDAVHTTPVARIAIGRGSTDPASPSTVGVCVNEAHNQVIVSDRSGEIRVVDLSTLRVAMVESDTLNRRTLHGVAMDMQRLSVVSFGAFVRLWPLRPAPGNVSSVAAAAAGAFDAELARRRDNERILCGAGSAAAGGAPSSAAADDADDARAPPDAGLPQLHVRVRTTTPAGGSRVRALTPAPNDRVPSSYNNEGDGTLTDVASPRIWNGAAAPGLGPVMPPRLDTHRDFEKEALGVTLGVTAEHSVVQQRMWRRRGAIVCNTPAAVEPVRAPQARALARGTLRDATRPQATPDEFVAARLHAFVAAETEGSAGSGPAIPGARRGRDERAGAAARATRFATSFAAVLYSPPFGQIVGVRYNGRVSVWSVNTGKSAMGFEVAAAFDDTAAHVASAMLDARARRLVVVGLDGGVVIWNFNSGARIGQLGTVDDECTEAAFIADPAALQPVVVGTRASGVVFLRDVRAAGSGVDGGRDDEHPRSRPLAARDGERAGSPTPMTPHAPRSPTAARGDAPSPAGLHRSEPRTRPASPDVHSKLVMPTKPPGARPRNSVTAPRISAAEVVCVVSGGRDEPVYGAGPAIDDAATRLRGSWGARVVCVCGAHVRVSRCAVRSRAQRPPRRARARATGRRTSGSRRHHCLLRRGRRTVALCS